MVKDIILKNKKILILGSPGSGKSTFAKQVSVNKNIQAYHLDSIKRQTNWKKTPKNKVIETLKQIENQNSYIVEGSYDILLENIIHDCDLIIILNTPTIVCLKRVILRTFISFITGKKGARDDIAKDCREKLSIDYLRFLNMILNYKKTKGLIMLRNLEKYKHKIKVL